jgi:hypothetical protein
VGGVDVDEACRHAEQWLRPLPGRWAHTNGVAAAAQVVASGLSEVDRGALVAAAWLHDVGYAPGLARSGFHPLDGARWLAALGEGRLAGLVAHHTGARVEAGRRGLGRELSAFEDENSIVSAGLVLCDLTTGPSGQRMRPDERLADIERRHGANSVVVSSLREAWPDLLEAVGRVEAELLGAGQPR